MGTLKSNYLHTKPSNFSLGPSRKSQSKINLEKVCMETIGPKSVHFSAAICDEDSISSSFWGIGHFFIMLFPNI